MFLMHSFAYFAQAVENEPIDSLVKEYRETIDKHKDREINPQLLKKSRNLRSFFPNTFVIISSFNLVIVCISHIIYWFESKSTVLAPDESNLFLIFVKLLIPEW
jgi:hypothetical protein